MFAAGQVSSVEAHPPPSDETNKPSRTHEHPAQERLKDDEVECKSKNNTFEHILSSFTPSPADGLLRNQDGEFQCRPSL